MKITPNSDIAIQGQHCASGAPVEVEDKLAKRLVAEGFASKSVEVAPEVETAAVDNEAETASASPKKARK